MKVICNYSVYASPLGQLLLGSTDKGLCWIDFIGEEIVDSTSLKPYLQEFIDHTSRWIGEVSVVYGSEWLTQTATQLDQYFQGQRTSFELPLDFMGTPFQKKVWSELCAIPYGETCSYKDIAERIGNRKAVRAVGGANNRNPIPIVVPCHRVIGKNGSLVGYGGGIGIKEFLLHLERGGVLGEICSS